MGVKALNNHIHFYPVNYLHPTQNLIIHNFSLRRLKLFHQRLGSVYVIRGYSK